MRLLALVGLVGLLSACGTGFEEESGQLPAAAQETTQQEPPESWCRSYTTQKYCPSVCFWYSSPAPGYCGLKPASVAADHEPVTMITAEQAPVQMGPPEYWCRSYTSQRFCPSVCFWHSEPAPGYCSAEGITE
ncbi:MAG TPA: hypothetical protein VF815_33735 [Myxococcaceae bacterium]|jgi:hypothetical protein